VIQGYKIIGRFLEPDDKSRSRRVLRNGISIRREKQVQSSRTASDATNTIRKHFDSTRFAPRANMQIFRVTRSTCGTDMACELNRGRKFAMSITS